MPKFILAYITTKNIAEAKRIGKRLVEERLAACVNILPGMQSIYRWQGKIESTRECVLIVKTRATLVRKLTARVTQLHSYTCPCVLILPISGGHDVFLKWLGLETG